jgi:hypothetical protein
MPVIRPESADIFQSVAVEIAGDEAEQPEQKRSGSAQVCDSILAPQRIETIR